MQKAQGKRYGYGLVLGLLMGGELMAVGGSALGQTGAGDGSGQLPAISVRVYNNAQFPNTLLRQAEDDAAGIFRAAGIEIAWTNCDPAQADLPQDTACDKLLDPTHLAVRILPDIPAAADITRRPLGTALGDLASVSLRRVREEAGRCQVMPQVVLGPVLAHEIGHLLLGTEGHSASGIMRARWQPEDYAPPYLRALSFTTEQAQTIRSEVRKRAQKAVPTEIAAP